LSACCQPNRPRESAVSHRPVHATTAVTELHYVDPSEKADEAAADAPGDLRRLAPGAER
jgi:hypothetical protein